MESMTTPITDSPAQPSYRGSTTLLLILLGIVIGTFFRISLLVLYPFVVVLLIAHFRFKLSAAIIPVLALLVAGFIFSFINGIYWQYKLLSLYHMLPFVLLLFAVPTEKTLVERELLPKFMSVLAVVAIINDIAGYIQFIKEPGDDSFKGIFSTYSYALYGLVIINLVLFTYYFGLYLQGKQKKELFKSSFFLISGVMGFYGAGLGAFLIAFVLSFFTLKLSSLVKTVLISAVSLLCVYYLTLKLRPEALRYYEASVQKMVHFEKTNGPRKIISFYNYVQAYPANPKDLLLGSGPGTFNSRSAFMIGSPSYSRIVAPLKSDDQPYYFKNYAYTLWNDTNTSQALYLDGFRNQPFSSLLAFLGEYGLLFTIVLLGCTFAYYKRVTGTVVKKKKAFIAAAWQFRFLLIFLSILFVIDNYYEYPETVILILFTMKLLHVQLLQDQPKATETIAAS
jgi:hypothetical protein